VKQLVSTLQPSPDQRRAALGVGAISALMFVFLAPFAKVPLRESVGFLAAYQSAFAAFDLITAVLLFAQYRILRSRALLLLAAAYVFSALMSTAHAMSFPGLFAAAGVFGGPQTTAWLYFLWHATFPLFIVGYTLYKDRAARSANGNARTGILCAIGAAITIAAVAILIASGDMLPEVMLGNSDHHSKLVVAIIAWLSPLGALWQLWRARPHTVLDLWVMVVLCVWTADIALAALLNGARFDVGWYAGRVYGLLASGFVLAVLLVENSVLYARLAEKHAQLEETSRQRSAYAEALGEALDDLEAANGDLRAFVASLAHDLQQPITTIISFAQVLKGQPGAAPEANARHLARIVSAGQWAQRMIKALLEFARLGQAPLHKEPVDLNDIVAEAKARVCGGDDEVRIEWRIGPLPTVEGDRILLLLAFVNMLSNAVKYTRSRERPMISIRSGPAGAPGRSMIEIADNGVGFDMAQASRLFKPFERLHSADEYEGTGMGLANVRRIVEKHGGRITAQGHVGHGAVFTIVLH